MNGKEVDHVPAGFWFHFSGGEAAGDACVQAHLNYYRETDLDFVKIMCDGYFPFPLPEISSPADWKKVNPFIRGQVERAKSKTNALLATLLVVEAGCDGVYYCVQGGEYDRFHPEEYREIIAPGDLYVLRQANKFSDTNIIHMCGWGGNKNQLELWKDYPAKAVNWAVFVEGLSLEEGRHYFGGRTVLGGFETHWDGTVQEGDYLSWHERGTAAVHERLDTALWKNRAYAGRGLYC